MINHICLFIFCTAGTITPTKANCPTFIMGEVSKQLTDKMVDNIVQGGVSYSRCGTRDFVESSELYKIFKREK